MIALQSSILFAVRIGFALHRCILIKKSYTVDVLVCLCECAVELRQSKVNIPQPAPGRAQPGRVHLNLFTQQLLRYSGPSMSQHEWYCLSPGMRICTATWGSPHRVASAERNPWAQPVPKGKPRGTHLCCHMLRPGIKVPGTVCVCQPL